MVFVTFGCGEKSGLEGKVLDGKGQPIAHVKIIAKQVQPIKGYERFEAMTGTDGSFSFKRTNAFTLTPKAEPFFRFCVCLVKSRFCQGLSGFGRR